MIALLCIFFAVTHAAENEGLDIIGETVIQKLDETGNENEFVTLHSEGEKIFNNQTVDKCPKYSHEIENSNECVCDDNFVPDGTKCKCSTGLLIEELCLSKCPAYGFRKENYCYCDEYYMMQNGECVLYRDDLVRKEDIKSDYSCPSECISDEEHFHGYMQISDGESKYNDITMRIGKCFYVEEEFKDSFKGRYGTMKIVKVNGIFMIEFYGSEKGCYQFDDLFPLYSHYRYFDYLYVYSGYATMGCSNDFPYVPAITFYNDYRIYSNDKIEHIRVIDTGLGTLVRVKTTKHNFEHIIPSGYCFQNMKMYSGEIDSDPYYQRLLPNICEMIFLLTLPFLVVLAGFLHILDICGCFSKNNES